MAGAYHIFGRTFKAHQLSIATLSTAFGIVALLKAGGKPAEPVTTPPINAASPEEEDFVKTFLKSIEQDDKKPAAH
ncbi:hypothetical protein V1514DRAFT_306259 [Lipomyces japonicus]|uniref:uncharacterized protein n=1 Tax=Lipomyces japonicus TaxID=56871 RepID=UPI0034CD3D7E